MAVEQVNADSGPIARLPVISDIPQKAHYEIGLERRAAVPLAGHAQWGLSPDRDVLATLAASNQGRQEQLVPIRHSRMAASAFAFYRGAPAVMAYDLSHAPSSDIIVQLCGDCHIGNFGLYASPDRQLVFDLNDFDETLPGPFEWDVKRMAASIVVAARNAELADKDARRAVRRALRSYREEMNGFATRSYLETWYSRIEATDILLSKVKKKHRKHASAELNKARNKDRLADFSKLTEVVDGERRIIHDPPLIYRLDKTEEYIQEEIRELFTAYYNSLDDSLKRLASRYRFVDAAHKVVGVGSVGTQCYIALWLGIDEKDPLFIQVKQAQPSLLEPYLGRSEYDHPGRRIITGQRLMQATHDIFLGYGQIGTATFFIRQLHDMKRSVNLETISAEHLERYSKLCAAVLARAHARTGDAAQIAGYLDDDGFGEALTEFAFRYADQNDADWRAFREAIADGRVEAADDENL